MATERALVVEVPFVGIHETKNIYICTTDVRIHQALLYRQIDGTHAGHTAIEWGKLSWLDFPEILIKYFSQPNGMFGAVKRTLLFNSSGARQQFQRNREILPYSVPYNKRDAELKAS